MADNGDLINFTAIETQKENIQSLPGGRSAKNLSSILSPLAAKKSPPLSDTQNLKDTVRQEFENELSASDESDDPLDIYDRYIKWTMDAYPTAQATAESNLLPLLERATKAFLTSNHYKSDPRYLKIWLLYIRLFSDSPRETYAFLARHNVGETLALFYEEFAAWLEGAGRWAQAEEVYLSGVDREARPQERLIRKFGEFQYRRETKAQQEDGPTSPALPKVRPALAAKVDPFAGSPEDGDPQARDRAAAARPAKAGRQKLAIFADSDEAPKPGSSDSSQGWDSIGSLNERKKENTREAKPWAGEKLDGGKRIASGPKLMVFKDQALCTFNEDDGSLSIHAQQRTVCVRTGKQEHILVDLESIYPDGKDTTGNEFCLEELRARHRGWLDRDWRRPQAQDSKPKHSDQALGPGNLTTDDEPTKLEQPSMMSIFADIEPSKPAPTKISIFEDVVISKASTTKLSIFEDVETSKAHITKMSIFEDLETSNAPVKIPIFDDESAPRQDISNKKKARREERANRTRKLQIHEVKAEPQTIQTNLDSPSGRKLKRKKSVEPTMTINTKEAMDEVYDLFNRTLNEVTAARSENGDSEADSDDDDDDDDNYTSAGESTGTGRISGAESEYGDETEAGFGETKTVDVTGINNTHGSGWSEFTEIKELPHRVETNDNEEGSTENITEEVTTPISPMHTTDDETEDRGFPSAEPSDNQDLSYRNFPRGQNRLPFMTPIVEKTESSLGALTQAAGEKDYFATKTPSRQSNKGKTPTIPELEKDDFWSSPFQSSLQDSDKENIKLAPPALTKSVKAKIPLETSKNHPAVMKDTKALKGPIIQDAQCNPMDESIHKSILSQIQPPIESYIGYFDRRGENYAKGSEIRKFTKATKGKGEKTCSLIPPPVLAFEGTSRQYTVRRELGKGAFAPVYLVDSQADDEEEKPVRMGEGEFGVQRSELEAVKMEEPPSAWEFYMIRQAKRRLGVSRPTESIVNVHEMHLFDDECYMIEEFRNQGTLIDMVNICRTDGSNGGVMDEQLVMFFTIELFRTVEALHAKGLIHGDIKGDNVLVRLNTLVNDAAWSSQYHTSGTGSWNEKGITLIDFGRGIDLKTFKSDVQFIADWKTSDTDCAEMREMRPWTFQVDYHGLAGVVHNLLFGKHLETIAERGATLGAGATRIYKVRDSLKRYWQTEIWNEVFGLLLNPLMHLDGEEGKKMPVLCGMKSVREKMEVWLGNNCEKGAGLKSMLRRMEGSIRERKK